MCVFTNVHFLGFCASCALEFDKIRLARPELDFPVIHQGEVSPLPGLLRAGGAVVCNILGAHDHERGNRHGFRCDVYKSHSGMDRLCTVCDLESPGFTSTDDRVCLPKPGGRPQIYWLVLLTRDSWGSTYSMKLISTCVFVLAATTTDYNT